MTKSSSARQQSRQQSGVQKIPTLKYSGRGKDQDRARLLEGIPDAFVSLDTQWQITYVNQQAEAVVGKTRADVLG